jgi:hypothetical protein
MKVKVFFGVLALVSLIFSSGCVVHEGSAYHDPYWHGYGHEHWEHHDWDHHD